MSKRSRHITDGAATRLGTVLLAGLTAMTAVTAVAFAGNATSTPTTTAAADLEARCQSEPLQQVAAKLARGVLVKQIPNGPQFAGGVKYVAAAGKTPAYCQVTGSYLTNPKTGKTANFIATFPAQWNGKYLQ